MNAAALVADKNLPLAPSQQVPAVGAKVLVEFKDQVYAGIVKSITKDGFDCFFPTDKQVWEIRPLTHKYCVEPSQHCTACEKPAKLEQLQSGTVETAEKQRWTSDKKSERLRWTEDEDQQLLSMVQKDGPGRWCEKARELGTGRTQKLHLVLGSPFESLFRC